MPAASFPDPGTKDLFTTFIGRSPKSNKDDYNDFFLVFILRGVLYLYRVRAIVVAVKPIEKYF